MKALTCSIASVAGIILALLCPGRAQVVINEFHYDDTGAADDREFVELFNSGSIAIDISGWTLTGHDENAATNPTTTIPADTFLGAGAFYVIGNAGLANVNQVVPSNTFENDEESIELYDLGGTLRDAVAYEINRTTTITTLADLIPQIGSGLWGNHQAIDLGTSPNTTPSVSIGRHLDGRDTNNNGRDFGLKPGTPGAPNNPAGIMTQYTAPNVDGLSDGDVVGGLTGSFVGARAFTPSSVSSALNPNAIPEPHGGFSKAIVAWDNSGGGNCVVSNAAFANGGRFDIQVYLDTVDLPFNTTTARGSEVTMFGIGSGDALTNLGNVSGSVLPAGTVTANAAAGVLWYYEKVGEATSGAGNVSEKLYLIDANDTGNSSSTAASGLDWTVLHTIDLSLTDSGWFDLSLAILPDGSGTAAFNGQQFAFTTSNTDLAGEFFVGYRENAPGIPSYLRPATFAAIPEPSAAALLVSTAFVLIRRRRQS